MRISDWSSDVCSSDLFQATEILERLDRPPVFEAHDLLGLSIAAMTGMVEKVTFRTDRMRALGESGFATAPDLADRSAERRVGIECVSQCGSRCSTYH